MNVWIALFLWGLILRRQDIALSVILRIDGQNIVYFVSGIFHQLVILPDKFDNITGCCTILLILSHSVLDNKVLWLQGWTLQWRGHLACDMEHASSIEQMWWSTVCQRNWFDCFHLHLLKQPAAKALCVCDSRLAYPCQWGSWVIPSGTSLQDIQN